MKLQMQKEENLKAIFREFPNSPEGYLRIIELLIEADYPRTGKVFLKNCPLVNDIVETLDTLLVEVDAINDDSGMCSGCGEIVDNEAYSKYQKNQKFSTNLERMWNDSCR